MTAIPRTESHHRRLHRVLTCTAGVVALLLLGGVVLLWGWNTFATELFAAPRLAFRHALALEVLALLPIAVPLCATRLFGHHPKAIQ